MACPVVARNAIRNSIAPAVNDLIHPLDGQSERSAAGLQTFAFSIALIDEVVAFFFGNMFFGDWFLGKRNTPIEVVKQQIDGEIQSG